MAIRQLAAGGACVLAAVCVGVPLASGRTTAQAADATAAPGTPIYLDRRYSFAERAADLVSRMTLGGEGVADDQQHGAGDPAARDPAYGWWNEALHGVIARRRPTTTGNATDAEEHDVVPDRPVAGRQLGPGPDRTGSRRRSATRRARSCRTTSSNLDFYSPTMNLERDPRWGRNDETYGEDPLLEAKLVGQFVNGMEGKDASGQLLPEGERLLQGDRPRSSTTRQQQRGQPPHGGSVRQDERTLREYYTSRSATISQASQPGLDHELVQRVNGVPAAANPYLIDTLLRRDVRLRGLLHVATATRSDEINARPPLAAARVVAARRSTTIERNALRARRRRGPRLQRRLPRQLQTTGNQLAGGDEREQIKTLTGHVQR